MKEGPDIARIAALIGDPARANILTALMSGKALTASELAAEAGVGLPTASSHLRKLEDSGLIRLRKSGRHRYFTLSGEEVAQVLEALMGLAAGRGHLRSRTGPKDDALRRARVCYNHLAGEMGVQIYEVMRARGQIAGPADDLLLTASGRDFVAGLGIDLDSLPRSRAPLCRECLDWSARQSHLAGRLGRALLAQFIATGWARRDATGRAVRFTPAGEAAFARAFARPPAETAAAAAG
ncbi:ArsR/SmtB family transcription factor [Pseudodonghicola flavimaris]|uniref:Winged helix-turn-helix domain-containing protein n=1 Tax=Pseudodonghicola flavimaris TaxID=3050036 RepID=A0ABT7EWB2_9RHOB|nr:winged helix-turn-helix domain-containing protein [Pseudodonghicola flavimaris]MDK3016632.1 winged helix-turn-helix domain-containing protein [Pseudodonghicola flavimaris]